MRLFRVLASLWACACSFEHGTANSPSRDAALADVIGSTLDTADAFLSIDAAAVCGNGVVEFGEECEVGMVSACATSCGDQGTQACAANCTLATCDVVVATSAWEVSTNASTWNATTLPNVNWPCDNCTRYFRTTVCDQPTAVEFRWSSDNRARMTVNGNDAFSTYWLANYCTDAPCCTKCCDTNANCLAHLSASRSLDAGALALFNIGTNVLRWEVNEEVGGSGFYTEMTIRY